MMHSPSRSQAATDRHARAYPFVRSRPSSPGFLSATLLAVALLAPILLATALLAPALLAPALLSPAARAAATGGPARAASVAIALDPHTTRVGYTVFAYGLLPVPATYDRFTGRIAFDAADATACTVELSVDMASLRMADPDHIRQALAPDMLDAAQFPTMHYAGICQDHALVGTLTLHGVSRPVTLAASRHGDQLVATGTLRRHDYGIAGMSGLVGSQIRIRITTVIPPAVTASLKALP